jgi:hypothetical protein
MPTNKQTTYIQSKQKKYKVKNEREKVERDFIFFEKAGILV